MKELDHLKALPGHTAASTAFLSRLPVWRVYPQQGMSFRDGAHTFALAGGLIAVLPVTLGLLASNIGAPPALAALVLLGAMMTTTGALHEDGLADVADGFWGGHTVERKLAIMRDSAIGTYGVLALLVVTAMRWTALTALFAWSWDMVALTYIAVASLSRFAILLPWRYLPAVRPAESDEVENGKSSAGLSARYGGPDDQSVIMGAIWASPAFFFLLWVSMPSIIIGGLAIAAIAHIARRHIGGHTGDVLGATQQLVEVGLLFGLALAMWTS
jgi:adenosylcobinamide-GDP ribazoletransferase